MASDINSCVLVGRLTREPKLEYTPNNLAKMSFSIACNKAKKLEDGSWGSEADFFDILYMGKGAEAIAPYIDKGKQVAVVGSLRQSRWEKDGQKHSKVYITADSVQLLGGKGETATSTAPAPFVAEKKNQPVNDYEEEFPEDIPF